MSSLADLQVMSNSSATESSRQQPVCPFFANRRCNRGRFCRFLHVINIDRNSQPRQNVEVLKEKRDDSDSLVEAGSQLHRSTLPQRRTLYQIQPVCKHFLHRGWCGYGQKCTFSHSVPAYQQGLPMTKGKNDDDDNSNSAETASGEDRKAKLGNATEANTIAFKSSRKKFLPASERMCKFFKAGYCGMGRRCWFKHVSLENQKDYQGEGDERSGDGGRDAGIAGDRRSVHSENSSDSGVVEDSNPVCQRSTPVDVIAEVDDEGKSPNRRQNNASQSSRGKLTPKQTLKHLREIEIEQLMKRYPNAGVMKIPSQNDDESETVIQFVFAPTDPDWPYDVKELHLQVTFPVEYPSEMLNIVLSANDCLPDSVKRSISEAIEKWVIKSFEIAKSSCKNQLIFRPFLRWLDKNAEDLFTEALKQFKRERMAEMAGIQFISADQLRSKFKSVPEENKPEKMTPNASSSDNRESCSSTYEQKEPNSGIDELNVDSTRIQGIEATNDEIGNTRACCELGLEEVARARDLLSEEESFQAESSSLRKSVMNPVRSGTEVILQNLQLLNCAATILATNLTVLICCGRCSNKCEVKTKVNQVNRVECPFCHSQQLVMFRDSIAHQFSSVIGYLDLEGCHAFDLILANCQFIINCLDCSKDNKIESLPPGQLNTTWCLHCHQKLTVAANSTRLVRLSSSSTAQLDVKAACNVEVKCPVKAVKDPAIVEGTPLPNSGTCKHYKKSYRWFRFPCCGKAYPCDICHDEKELGHEMKRANRMICGLCAKEQPYSSERPCSGCQANLTNKPTAHWEGGAGCRDKLKMSRGDSKKYTDSQKTVSRSFQNKGEPGKKVTKLRHL